MYRVPSNEEDYIITQVPISNADHDEGGHRKSNADWHFHVAFSVLLFLSEFSVVCLVILMMHGIDIDFAVSKLSPPHYSHISGGSREKVRKSFISTATASISTKSVIQFSPPETKETQNSEKYQAKARDWAYCYYLVTTMNSRIATMSLIINYNLHRSHSRSYTRTSTAQAPL